MSYDSNDHAATHQGDHTHMACAVAHAATRVCVHLLYTVYLGNKKDTKINNILLPLNIGSRDASRENPRAHVARAPCMEKIYGNIRKPARARRVRAMH
jgi:hypothetical protein